MPPDSPSEEDREDMFLKRVDGNDGKRR